MTATKFDEARYVGMEQAGRSAREIALAFGVADRTVHRWRARAGFTHTVSPLAFKPPTPDRVEAARVLLDDGASYSEVYRTTHLTVKTLQRLFPGRGWSQSEAGKFASTVRWMNDLVPWAS